MLIHHRLFRRGVFLTYFFIGLTCLLTTVTVTPADAQQADDDALQTAPVDEAPVGGAPSGEAPEPTEPAVVAVQPAAVQPAAVEVLAKRVGAAGDAGLSFNFTGADWRMVLEWLAGEANLSLQADRVPPGTVNFTDPSRTYTASEAMDVLNRLLLDRGFALVRRGRLLMLINLESDNASGLINEVAELVTPEELDERAASDIVRSIFSLGSLTAEAAKNEISQLIGPAGKLVVLESAKQIVVTETVAKLKSIRSLLSNAAMAGSEVTEIVLKNRNADEVLEIARPLLGLENGVNSNESIRIATSLYGDRLFATGQSSQMALLKRIVERVDTPVQAPTEAAGDASTLPRLETYAIAAVDPQTVVDVLQTLLAGLPDTRITTDPQSKGLIAFARPETHTLIRQTIDKLEGKGSTFEIIQLRRLEPAQALATINKFFGVTAQGGDGPTVDGDPLTSKLWVRGTPEQIKLVRELIEQLEGSDAMGALSDRVRILPYTGKSAEQTVEQLQQLWNVTGRKSKIRMVTPGGKSAGPSSTRNGITFPQRRVAGDRQEKQGDTSGDGDDALPLDARPVADPPLEVREPDDLQDASSRTTPAYRLVTQQDEAISSPPGKDANDDDDASTTTGDIVVTMTPTGMIVVSDDPAALAEFEKMMRTLTDQTSLGSDQPTVFWLKFAKADDAASLVTKILGGSDASSSGGGGLAGSMLGELGGGMIGGLLGIGGGGSESSGPVLTTTGSVSIIPDGRLNALIVQANPIDMRMIEMVLEVIDREESPEDVQTTSRPQVIPVIYQSAADVSTIVKGVYAERTADQNSQQRQPSPQDFINALRGGRGGGGGGGGDDKGSKPAPITIAVDAKSNSLIVSAPPQDFEDIRELVEAIDAGGISSEETVEIISIGGNVKAEVVQKALESVLGKQTSSTGPAASANTSAAAPKNANQPAAGQPSAEDIQRRIEFFRQLRGGGGGAPGGDGGGFGGGGGGRGGGGGGLGGRGGGRGGRGN